MISEIHRAGGERSMVIKPPLRSNIHDVCGSLDGISNFAQAARSRLDEGRITDARTILVKIENRANYLNEFLREVLAGLRTEDGALRLGLAPAIGKLVDELGSEIPMVRFEFETRPSLSILTPAQEECFYVVARESLRNAVRHAKGLTSVRVLLDCSLGSSLLKTMDKGPALLRLHPRRMASR